MFAYFPGNTGLVTTGPAGIGYGVGCGAGCPSLASRYCRSPSGDAGVTTVRSTTAGGPPGASPQQVVNASTI